MDDGATLWSELLKRIWLEDCKGKGRVPNFFCKKYGLLPAAMNMMTMLFVIMVMRVGRRRKRGGWEAIRPPREPTPVLLATPSSHQHCFSSSINLFEHHKVVVNIPWLFYFTTWRINLLKKPCWSILHRSDLLAGPATDYPQVTMWPTLGWKLQPNKGRSTSSRSLHPARNLVRWLQLMFCQPTPPPGTELYVKGLVFIQLQLQFGWIATKF